MTVLPIVDRELRVRARLRSTYRFRFFAAVGAILIVAVLLLGSLVAERGSQLGKSIFVTLAGLAFIYCLMEGARNTADCLSSEKREGTLGLLFLTDLKGYDVVIGKLVASSINSFYGLMAVFPALAIPLVLGGLTGGEFWRHVLALINALFLSLTTGLFVSSVSRDERTAWMTTSLLVFILTVVPPFLLLIPSPVAFVLAALSPFTAFLGAFDGAFTSRPEQYWNSIRVVQALSWCALLTASWLLPRRWQDRPPSMRATARPRPQNIRQANADARRRFRLLETNPVLWMTSRREGSPGALWALVLGTSFIGVAGWIVSDGTAGLGLWWIMIIVHFMLSVWMASEACHLLGVARDSGALELLVSTPLTTQQIVSGHLLALKQKFFRPVAMLMAVELCLLAASAFVENSRSGLDSGHLIGVAIVLLMMLGAVLELQAVAYYGLWMGLVSKRPGQAVSRTVLRVILLWMLTLPCMFFYPFIAIIKNLVFMSHAQDQLRRNLRRMVTERFVDVSREELITDPPRHVLRGQLPPVQPR
ncbi:MAG TPA: ABC transporter permease [Verrucomicrobiae bacterium]|nr:ABC transporter permease [Verrucomicrobiae bacterium]